MSREIISHQVNFRPSNFYATHDQITGVNSDENGALEIFVSNSFSAFAPSKPTWHKDSGGTVTIFSPTDPLVIREARSTLVQRGHSLTVDRPQNAIAPMRRGFRMAEVLFDSAQRSSR